MEYEETNTASEDEEYATEKTCLECRHSDSFVDGLDVIICWREKFYVNKDDKACAYFEE